MRAASSRALGPMIRVILALVVSAAGFAGFFLLAREPVRALVVLVPEDGAAGTRALSPPALAPTLAPSGAAHMPALRQERVAEPPPAPRPQANDEPEGVIVPDLTGKRLSVARREAKALKLKLVARDEWGERILPELAAFYRVRRQLTVPGTAVVAGSRIELRVRDIGGVAQGY